ncbi:MAG: phosphodiesterase [Acutalibacteraceae bacterium]|nr:phosphodiesterase [Acutalibacteraceae bacterium]
MKLMIASDIHGSAYYCEKLKNAYNKEKPDKLVLLGDILYHGPRNDLPKDYAPKRVIELLNAISEHIICIRGNCDTEVDQMVLNFSVLSESVYLFVDGITFFAAHGHNYNEHSLPKLSKGTVFLNGHTHVPVYRKHDEYIYINCGSVSIPKENSEHTYLIYENGVIHFKNLSGEVYDSRSIK